MLCGGGAEVIERFSDTEIGKGFALKKLTKYIDDKYGLESFDYFLMFDADNLLANDYIEKMNEAFVYGYNIVTSYRNIKNFDSSAIASGHGIHHIRNMRSYYIPRNILNLSTHVTGTGWGFKSSIIKDKGWEFLTITEDWEFNIEKGVLEKNAIAYCHDAVFYDEQPTNLKITLRQRLRWTKGHQMIFRMKFKKTLKKVKKDFLGPKYNYWFSKYDMVLWIVPMNLILFFWKILFNLTWILLTHFTN